MTGLILWVAFASVFCVLLGYTRVPYAAAVRGAFFSAFARVASDAQVSLVFGGVHGRAVGHRVPADAWRR